MPGRWELPGGIVEFGEEPRVATAREVKEESRLDVSVEKLLFSFSYTKYKKKHIVCMSYLCYLTNLNQEVVLSPEHTDYKWASLGDAIENQSIFLKDTLKEVLMKDPEILREKKVIVGDYFYNEYIERLEKLLNTVN